MDIETNYQEWVRENASPKYDKNLAIIGLVGEIGELADVVKKENIYEDMSKFEQKYGMTVEEKIIDEAGDVLWQFINLLNQYGVSLQRVVKYNIHKLKGRHGNEKIKKDGGNR